MKQHTDANVSYICRNGELNRQHYEFRDTLDWLLWLPLQYDLNPVARGIDQEVYSWE